MGREIVVCWAGRHRRDAWSTLADRYLERISRQIPAREVAVRARGSDADPRRLTAEGEALLGASPEPSWRVALDRKGTMRSSRELAAWLRQRREEWPHPIVFLVGSDLGLAPEVIAACRESLSFGPMTLPHELARLVLLEQLYRACTMDAGIRYHRESF